jgi:ADP-ribosyl-[dinitrogen reductase] hydrolase
VRLAPVAVRWWRDPDTAEAVARRQGLTTHAAPEAADACALLARMLAGAINGGGREAVLAPGVDPGWRPPIRAIAAGGWRGKAEADVRSTGHVVHTLEAAVWAFAGTASFEEAVLRAVNLGDDADTVGAVAGQIAGAVYGLGGIPERWTTGCTGRGHPRPRQAVVRGRPPRGLSATLAGRGGDAAVRAAPPPGYARP